MMPPEKLRRADLLASSFLILLGAAVIVGGLGMPLSGTYGGRPIYWYTSPAFFPILLGVLLILFSLSVLGRAVRERAHAGILGFLREELEQARGAVTVRRGLLVLGLLAGYIALLAVHPFAFLAPLLERVPGIYSPATRFLAEPEGVNYALSSAIFLLVTTLIFWRRTVWALVLACGLSWAVAWAFTEKLYAPLPWLD